MHYKKLSKKELIFRRYYKIDTIEDFFEHFKDLKEQLTNQYQTLIFRGCTEAKYKLYNSLQRFYLSRSRRLNKEDYKTLVIKLMKKAKNINNHLLESYFKSFGINHYDIAILSFLQHYGTPTPILDWTYSYNVALFFGINSQEKHVLCGKEIDNYFSLYTIVQDSRTTKNHKLKYFNDIINNSRIDKSKLVEELFKYNLTLITDSRLRNNNRHWINNDYINTLFCHTNFNVLSQKGLFIFNSSPTKPLEKFMKKQKIFDGFNNNDNIIDNINCIDINKQLIPLIKIYLNLNKIKGETLFPKPESIAKEVKEILI